MKKLILVVVNVLIIGGLLAFGGFYFKKYQDLKKNPPTADQAAQATVEKTVTDVGKLYDLPKDEKPTIVPVKDVTAKLKEQPFFAKAQNNDLTLYFSKAKLVILYRPSTKQIVNVSTVSIQNNPVVKVYGPGRAAALGKLTSTQVTASDGGDVTASLSGVTVVDLSGTNAASAQTIATSLGGQVGQLPVGEAKPSGVDIAVFAQ